MSDFLDYAKEAYTTGAPNGDGWAIAAALIALTEEVRKLNEQPPIITNINVPAGHLSREQISAALNDASKVQRRQL